ncbi:MAG: hypothetical protein JRJ76_12935, partial [Deltaproteobacteria bacterium]|nr:hypothetical protein [Deltaproteobacteria bacterium]
MLNPPKQFENMKKYEHITNLAQSTKAVSPPDGFTEKVMENLPPGPHAAESKLMKLFFLPFKKHDFRAWIEVETDAECAFCFLMAGFFYFIMGIVLAVGLKTTVSIALVSGVIMLQPQIAFATAFVFITLGITLLKQSIFAIKIAHFWIFLYIGFSILNSIVIQMAPGNPFSVIGMLCLTTGAVLLGFFLAVIVHKYKEMVAYDENFIRT